MAEKAINQHKQMAMGKRAQPPAVVAPAAAADPEEED